MRPSEPIPRDTSRHFLALQALEVGGDAQDPIFDAFASAAAVACDTPIGHVIVGDARRQIVIGSVGVPNIRKLKRPCAFCSHLIATGQALVVPDAAQDVRFAGHHDVTGPNNIQFFAGVPLRSGRGETLGTLCVVDHVPHRLTRDQLGALRWLADIVTDGLGSRDAALQAIEEAPRSSEGEQHIDALLHDALREVARVEGVLAPAGYRQRRVTEAPYDLPDPNCLAITEVAEVLLWADDLSLSAERLREIVAIVGPMRAAIRTYVTAQRRAAVSLGDDPSENDD